MHDKDRAEKASRLILSYCMRSSVEKISRQVAQKHLCFRFSLLKAGFKIRQIFFGAERSGGAEILENFDFLVFFMKFSRKIAQKGPKRSQITPDALAR